MFAGDDGVVWREHQCWIQCIHVGCRVYVLVGEHCGIRWRITVGWRASLEFNGVCWCLLVKIVVLGGECKCQFRSSGV